ncbi:unnamed protein product [Musa acuminata subsp. burmannicoides]|uniref:(wild Malaysian banana) hypothetical protein n=1 Tax=Musa acuminata subsp. malaccensis TaxID=214687 RepID=A0A804HRW9_MUSAM|nr:unnamed protein product [Musa acuminata subsp. malaccensis]
MLLHYHFLVQWILMAMQHKREAKLGTKSWTQASYLVMNCGLLTNWISLKQLSKQSQSLTLW